MSTSETIQHDTSENDYGDPYIDLEEDRSSPLPHGYVHGGFRGTELRFSFYLPARDVYEGRFFQHFTPVPESENLAQGLLGQEDKITFAVTSGAAFVETNGGGASGGPGSAADPTIAGFKANAAAAEFFKVLAKQRYGDHRVYGYAYGASGGAYRTFGAAENTVGVWDGFVPHVAGSPMAAPNVTTVRMHAQRVLRDRFAQIVDSVEPGGTRDPYAKLNTEEAAALLEVTRMGFPIRSWFGYETMGTQSFGLIGPIVMQIDPSYFRNFWSTPGHLAADPSSSVHRDRVVVTTSVSEVLHRTDHPDLGPLDTYADGPGGGADTSFSSSDGSDNEVVAVRLSDAPQQWLRSARLTIDSGDAAGSFVSIRGVHVDLAVIDFPSAEQPVQQLKVGDTVTIDNSDFLAAQTYHRHQVPGSEYTVYDQYRDEDGSPLLPQRPFLIAPMFAAGAAGHVPNGQFAGRMILVESLLDRDAFPWQADWYRARAAEHLGNDLDDRFRVWFIDNALHGDVEQQEDPTHTVSYLGVLHQALRDLAAWVEQEVPPAPSTTYDITDGQVVVPSSANARHGIQPVIRLLVNGDERADVHVGDDVSVEFSAQVPEGAGPIVQVEWDLDGDGVFEETVSTVMGESVALSRTARADAAGTFFVSARVSSQRQGDASTPIARIDNVARARIVAS